MPSSKTFAINAWHRNYNQSTSFPALAMKTTCILTSCSAAWQYPPTSTNAASQIMWRNQTPNLFGRKASDKMKGFHPSSQKRFLSVDGRWHEAQKIQLKKNMRILLNKPVEKPLRSKWFAHPVLSVMKNTKNSVLQQAPAWSWCNWTINASFNLPAHMQWNSLPFWWKHALTWLLQVAGSGSTMADGR